MGGVELDYLEPHKLGTGIDVGEQGAILRPERLVVMFVTGEILQATAVW